MATLGSLIISLEANTAKFTEAMTKAEYAAKKTSDNITKYLGGIGAAIAGMVSVAALEGMFKSIITMESNLVKLAIRLNTTAETLASLGGVARAAGMDADSFAMALTRMEKNLSTAVLGVETSSGKLDENGEAIISSSRAWDQLGIKVAEFQKLKPDQQLKVMSDQMKANIDPADRVGIALQIFGKAGAGMVQPLSQGGDALQKLIDREKELNPLTNEMAAAGALAKKATSELSVAVDGFATNLVAKATPAITTMINKLTDFVVAANKSVLSTQNMMNIAKEIHAGSALGKNQGYPAPPPTTTNLTPPKDDVIPNVTKDPIRPAAKATGGGGSKSGGGGGSSDTGLDRMQTIIDTLTKDLNKLTEGSLAEITAWATHMRNEIEKVGKKGADTSVAMALVDKTETAKKLKATEDYDLFVAKASGDTYKEIEGQAKADLEKYKGFATAKSVIDAETARKKNVEDRKNETDRDNLLKGYLEEMANITLDLKQQYDWKKKILDLDIKMSKQALEDSIKSKGKGLSPEMADEQRKLLAMTNQTKKFKTEWESVQAQTQQYSLLLSTIGSSFSSVLSGIASGTTTVAAGITTLLKSVQDALLTMIMNMVMKWAEGQVMILGLNAAASMGLITQEAAVAGAKAYSAYAAIPFVGLALGAAAAAAVMGIMMAFGSSIGSSAGGDYQVLGSGLREVHKDETILPAWAASSWRDIVSRGDMPGGRSGEAGARPGENGKQTGGGSTTVVNYNPTYHIQAKGTIDFEKSLAKHGQAMVKIIKKQVGTRGVQLKDGRS